MIHVISGGEFEEVDGELLAEFGDREDSFLVCFRWIDRICHLVVCHLACRRCYSLLKLYPILNPGLALSSSSKSQSLTSSLERNGIFTIQIAESFNRRAAEQYSMNTTQTVCLARELSQQSYFSVLYLGYHPSASRCTPQAEQAQLRSLA